MPFSVFIPCKYLSADFVISNAKFFHFSRKATPAKAGEGWLPAAKIKIADNKNKKARASPWGQGTRLLLCLGNTA
jgi:hypothetical protein